MTRRLVGCLLGLVLLAVALAGATAGGPVDGGTAGLLQPQTTPDEFDNTVFRVRIYGNGSARWAVVYSTPLANESEIAAFEAYAAEFNANETTLFRNFRARAQSLVGFGENVTGRPMNATAFRRRAGTRQLGGARGFVEMSFEWTHFARSEGDRVVVDDVFRGGMYVSEGQRLVFQRGPAVAFVEVAPDPDSLAVPGNLTGSPSVTWFGEQQFADQRPSLELGPRASVSGGNPDEVTTTRPPTATVTEMVTPSSTVTTAAVGARQDGSGGPPAMMLLAGVIVLVALGVGLAWYGGLVPTPAGRSGGSGGADAAAGAESSSGPSTAGVPGEELLSDEDRVEQLLEDNGGRMKQVSIVEETDWSKSKVSMLLSEMEDDGRISKLRVGRENIISLAGQEPEAAGSPFDEE